MAELERCIDGCWRVWSVFDTLGGRWSRAREIWRAILELIYRSVESAGVMSI